MTTAEKAKEQDTTMKKRIQLHNFLMEHSELELLKESPLLQQLYSATCARSLGTWLPAAHARTRLPSQPQHFDLNHTTLERPMACIPRDQLPTYNHGGQCVSGGGGRLRVCSAPEIPLSQ